ncbi:MAG: YgfZ/GcvT domain-containing protein [Geodermatophilaceae bacterium]
MTTTMPPSALLDTPGAVPAEGLDTGVALHYGDPLREQRTLTESVGWVDRSHRDILLVPGVDRLSWLHSLTSQHLSELADGRATEALVLSPHGHVEHHLVVTEIGGRTWLDVEPGTGLDLLAFLDSMRFLLRVDPQAVGADWAMLSLVGPRTPAVLAALGVPELSPYDVAPLGTGWARAMPWPGEAAADLLVPRAELPATVGQLAAAGAAPAGSWAYEAMRVQSRRPRLRFETDHRTIPHEVGWLDSAVHLNKGCYRGQETVARVHNLGRPPRRLVLLHLDGSQESLPATGDPISLAGRQVGFVTTAVRHHELGPVALALIKRNTADDAELQVGSQAASIDT